MRRSRERGRRVSRTAQWAIRAALFAGALIVTGLILHRLFGMATPVALNLFGLGVAMAGAAFLLALFAMVRIWRSGAYGFGAAGGALLIAGATLAWPLSYAPVVIGRAPLNDITTDFENPPELSAAVKLRAKGANAATYAGADAARIQTARFPDILPIVVARPGPETFDLVAQALRRLSFQIVIESEPEGDAPGIIEAVAVTPIVGFKDDVVVRVVGRGGRSRIDIRSASRWGRDDLDRNATRVRQIVRAILERQQATVPASAAKN